MGGIILPLILFLAKRIATHFTCVPDAVGMAISRAANSPLRSARFSTRSRKRGRLLEGPRRRVPTLPSRKHGGWAHHRLEGARRIPAARLLPRTSRSWSFCCQSLSSSVSTCPFLWPHVAAEQSSDLQQHTDIVQLPEQARVAARHPHTGGRSAACCTWSRRDCHIL